MDHQDRVSVETPSSMGDQHWTSIMSNVLNELFYMGCPTHDSKFSRKKCPRKQTNPTHFLTSSSNDNVKENSADFVRKENFSTANSFNDGVMDAKEESFGGRHAEEEKEKEKSDDELVGYSKCEVTVIDTSCPVWKFDKLVFRKSDAWKVKDKKGKSQIFGKNKRKGNLGYATSGGGGKKKAKFATLEFEDNTETTGKDGIRMLNEGKISKQTKGRYLQRYFK